MTRDRDAVRRRPEVRVVRLVRVTYVKGAGVAPDDPVREVDAYYELDGSLVFEVDSWLAARPLTAEEGA